MPHISIVIPTHNRRALVQRALAALALQTYPLDDVEVLVVADGCTDGTEATVIPHPLKGRVIAQPARGPAAARNRGAAEASGDLLLFLDDDVDAWPNLVAAHAQAHAAAGMPAAVVGYLPPRLDERNDLFAIALRGWWSAMFERMRETGHRFTYADLLSGNFSIPAALFEALGGFEERLTCHEDYEFGFRVLRAGVRILFEPQAAGWHSDQSDVARALRRKHEEGISDVWLARRHPEIWPALPCAFRPASQSRRERRFRELAVSGARIGPIVASSARLYLRLLGRAGARDQWRILLYDLLTYWYWRGVADALDGTAFAQFEDEMTREQDPDEALPDINLRPGLLSAARELDDLKPRGVVLHYAGVHVATILPQPWAEPLGGRHLRHLLITSLERRFTTALAAAHALDRIRSRSLDEIRAALSIPPSDEPRV
jgi:GT2 family glycosyltransferase